MGISVKTNLILVQNRKKATFPSDLYRQNLHSRLELLIKIPFDE